MLSRRLLVPLYTFLLPAFACANGVAIIDAETLDCLHLETSHVGVLVENQVAQVLVRQEFRNLDGIPRSVKYGFPMAEDASATRLRFRQDGEWHDAGISAAPADTTLPGGTPHPALGQHLGNTPLFYQIEDPVAPDSLLAVELSYVQLLPYGFGRVSFDFPASYTLIQPSPLQQQAFFFELFSPRTIIDFDLDDIPLDSLVVDPDHAVLLLRRDGESADMDYHVEYELDPDELGLFGFSTFQDEQQVPDGLGNGFFAFVAEPDPGLDTDVIHKVFTLVIDRSGSMLGEKMQQAKDAASWIVDHMNEDDLFNLIDFDTEVTPFMPGHVENTPANRQLAQAFISQLWADGWTNISGAFQTAIPQFSGAGSETANIIIFLTDGEATYGETSTEGILEIVEDLDNANETDVSIFTFGIGASVNEQLLTLLASEHHGLAEFLADGELEARITDFFRRINNPVLLNTEISFDPPIVAEVYPAPLPNLYLGTQMIVSGRYTSPAPLEITLSGSAFGQPLAYSYTLEVADSSVSRMNFLPRIWAKQKIEHLVIEYYSLDPGSPQAEELLAQIVGLSQAYGVLSPFTSYQGETAIEEDGISEKGTQPQVFELPGNLPNPFNGSTRIRFRTGIALDRMVEVRIYNTLGQLVRVLQMDVGGPGLYEVTWDGLTETGHPAASGAYIYVVDIGDGLLASRMTLLK